MADFLENPPDSVEVDVALAGSEPVDLDLPLAAAVFASLDCLAEEPLAPASAAVPPTVHPEYSGPDLDCWPAVEKSDPVRSGLAAELSNSELPRQYQPPRP